MGPNILLSPTNIDFLIKGCFKGKITFFCLLCSILPIEDYNVFDFCVYLRKYVY